MFNKIVKGIFSKGDKPESPIKIGDNVKVKEGVNDPDDEDYSIADWQGWVVEVYDENLDENNIENLQFMVSWDSVTLKNIPRARLIELEREGYDWTMMCLDINDVDIATPRDKMEDAEAVSEALSDDIYWEGMGEEGEQIAQILGNSKTEKAAYKAWETYLKKELTFPFTAEFYSEESTIIQNGVNLIALKLGNTDKDYGISVEVSFRNSMQQVPLSDLSISEEESPNFKVLDLYSTWFTNKRD